MCFIASFGAEAKRHARRRVFGGNGERIACFSGAGYRVPGTCGCELRVASTGCELRVASCELGWRAVPEILAAEIPEILAGQMTTKAGRSGTRKSQPVCSQASPSACEECGPVGRLPRERPPNQSSTCATGAAQGDANQCWRGRHRESRRGSGCTSRWRRGRTSRPSCGRSPSLPLRCMLACDDHADLVYGWPEGPHRGSATRWLQPQRPAGAAGCRTKWSTARKCHLPAPRAALTIEPSDQHGQFLSVELLAFRHSSS